MVDQRKEKRAPASLKVKYKSATVDQFVEQFGTDVSRGGMFIKTKTPLEMGTLLKLELQLSDASPVIQGMGRVCWRRAVSTDPQLPTGMGLKFVKLEESSRATIERIVKGRGALPSRFDQTQGAELEPPAADADASADARVSAPVPAPVAAAAAAPMRTSPASAPRASVPNKPTAPVVAGLFARSAIASQPPEPPPDRAARSSFFPPAPAPAARPAIGPAGAFGSAKPASAPPPSAPPKDDEDDAFDKLFDEVQRGSSAAPPAQAPASVAPRSQSFTPAPAPAVTAPSEMDDVFGALSQEEGLLSTPPARPSASPSAPDSAVEALAELAGRPRASSAGRVSSPGSASASSPGRASSPGHTSSPGRTSSPGLSLPLPGDDDDFGEADIGGGMSAPPPPSGSQRPPSLPPSVMQELAEPKKRSALPLILGLVVLAAAGGGYVYYQQMLAQQAAKRAADEAAARVLQAAEGAAQPAGAGAAGTATAGGAATAGNGAKAGGAQAPAVMVQVEVSSVPRGADVLVSGNRVGMTPMRVELPVGQPTNVSVSSPGFAAQTRSVVAVANQEPLRFKLEPLDYVLYVISDPPEADLEIGGKQAVAPGPLELGHLDGGVVVTVSKNGHQRMTRPVRLEEFSESEGKMRADIEVRLSPLPGFNAAPGKAKSKPGARKPGGSGNPAPPAAEPTGAAAPPAAAPLRAATPAPTPAPAPAPSAAPAAAVPAEP